MAFAVGSLYPVTTTLLVLAPVSAHAQAAPDPQDNKPIVPDAEFDKALPPLSNDINAPLEPIPAAPPPQSAPLDPALDQPLAPITTFESTPLETTADVKDKAAPEIRYETATRGLEEIGLAGQFKSLSSLRSGGGKAANASQIRARAREDEALAVRLMKSLGYYDGTAVSVIEQVPNQPGMLRATVSATPGKLYHLGAINVVAPPTVPPGLIRAQLPLKTGDAIDAARIEGAEANVSLVLPQHGYPFAKVGQRDILLDDQTLTGDYTLPVETGPRGSFGKLRTAGDPVFGLKHLNVFPRFKPGESVSFTKCIGIETRMTPSLPTRWKSTCNGVSRTGSTCTSRASTMCFVPSTSSSIAVEVKWPRRTCFHSSLYSRLIVSGVSWLP